MAVLAEPVAELEVALVPVELAEAYVKRKEAFDVIEMQEYTVDLQIEDTKQEAREGFLCGLACTNGAVCGVGCAHGVGSICGTGCD